MKSLVEKTWLVRIKPGQTVEHNDGFKITNKSQFNAHIAITSPKPSNDGQVGENLSEKTKNK